MAKASRESDTEQYRTAHPDRHTEQVEDTIDDQDEDVPTAPWRSLFSFTTGSSVSVLVAAISMSLILGAVPPAQSYFIGKIFGTFSTFAAGTLPKHEFTNSEIKYVKYLLILSAVALIGASIDMALWLAFGELQAKSARDGLFRGLLEKDQEWYDMRRNGISALLPRLQARIREVQLATSQPLAEMVGTISTALLSLIQALVLSWKLTLVILSTSPLIMVAVAFVGGRVQKAFEKQGEELSVAQKHTTTAFAAIDTVKCFNAQNVEHEKYMASIMAAGKHYCRAASWNAVQMALVVFLSTLMFVQGFFYGATLVASGEVTAATVITTFLSAIAVFETLSAVMPQLIVLEQGRMAGSALKAAMAASRDQSNHPDTRARIVPARCRGDIEVANLTFCYPAQPNLSALQNVSMYFPAGEMTFLIGKSGSGKSTIGRLLMRYYSSYTGRLSVDGVPLSELEIKWLRSNSTLVEQTSVLFNDTIFQNIALGRKRHEMATRQEIVGAAEFALMLQTVNDMPEEFDTLVGGKGSTLSGGQRQRMALARARLRDTPILILDEATSALDQISRSLMVDAIRHWRKGRTTIVITHDISQILRDDYLYVLERGKLVQEGYRKHLEVLRGSPFQSFLSEDDKATSVPYDAHRVDALDRSATVNVPPLSNNAYTDALEARLVASENRRTKIYASAFSGVSPYMASRAPARNRSSRWMRFTSSPQPEPCSIRHPPGEGFIESIPLALRNDVSVAERRQRASQDLHNLLDRTGNIAVGARRLASGGPRQRKEIVQSICTTTSAVTSHFGSIDSTADRTNHSSPVNVPRTLHRILGTIWPNLDAFARITLLSAFWAATIHAISTPLFSFILSKLLRLFSIPGGDKHSALIYSMILLGIAAIDTVHSYLLHYLFEYTGQHWVNSVRGQAMHRILDQPREFFDAELNAAPRLTGCLDRNAEEMRNLLGRFLGLGWTALLMSLISIVWAMVVQWKMTLIALAVAPYMLGVTKAYAAVSEKWERLCNDAAENAAIVFTETFTSIKTVRALTLEDHFTEKYVKATDRALAAGYRRACFVAIFYGLSDSATNFSITLVLYVGSRLVASGTPVQDIVQVLLMLIFAITSVNAILGYIPQIGSSKDTASRLLRLAYLPKQSHEHLGAVRIRKIGDIAFNKLDFSYPSRLDTTVFRHLNLHIKQGSCTAIVGGSGSGKSTIANLLLKLYTTSSHASYTSDETGDLTLGGRDIKRVDTATLRSLAVSVSQTPILFPATIAENISYGLVPTSPYSNNATIVAAAERAGIHDFINSLPQGYSTVVGEGGMGLSGGQAQRIAIARALVRNAAVLILDEATSALDVESANLVRQTVQNLVWEREGRDAMTVIIITHSREMMEIAESVVVLDQGWVVEHGEFWELVGRNGALANLLSGGQWTGEEPDVMW